MYARRYQIPVRKGVEEMNNEFAAIIEHNIEGLVNDWVQSVRADETIKSSEDLSEGGLRDHIPQVLEEIAELLRQNINPNISNTREARVAAYTRYKQNYRLHDLVSEISLLRRTIFDCLEDCTLNPDVNLALPEYVRAVRLINAYLDEELRYSVSVFRENDSV